MPRDRTDVHSALVSKGFDLKQKGRDHDFYFLRHDGLTRAVFTKISRGFKYKEIGDGLLSRMGRQLHLTRAEFEDLIDCPMTQGKYVALMAERGVLETS